MKTQISRDSLQKSKRYSAVYQQQGRAVLDSDINELSDIVKNRLNDALYNAIYNGAPVDNGLAIVANKDIAVGRLYVDGILAEIDGSGTIAFTQQNDLINPQAMPVGDFQIYADVWQRSVNALEDQQLLDPGLHGADTCTRSQTMLQIKWADNSVDLADLAVNPTIGNAQVSLSLRQIFVSEDLCDPCSIEVELDERIGNYLFRVEVHEVYQQDGDNFVTLKWSRDNGAEQFLVDNVPDGFSNGYFAYEFFDDECEKNLGNHLMGVRVKRGTLVQDFSDGEPSGYVRQWDGFCTINLDALSVQGNDVGTDFADNVNEDAHGYYAIAQSLSVNLELLQLTITLDGRDFVAGDFWFTPVREAVNEPGDFVLGDETGGELPNGVEHHYLWLADVDNAGNLIAQSDAQRRRFNFPALSNIMASDIGFIESCNNLFHGAQNVQQALDELCNIGAQDIGYDTPACISDSILAYMMADLAQWADLDNDDKISVKDMLDAIFCHLNAARLPYTMPECGDAATPTVRVLLGLNGGDVSPLSESLDVLLCRLNAVTLPYQLPQCGSDDNPTVRSLLNLPAGQTQPLALTLDALLCNLDAERIPLNPDGHLCPDLAEAQTVQQALQLLCEREVATAGGCSIAVDGVVRSVDNELSLFSSSATLSIWLCLQAFEHVVAEPVTIAGKDTVKIIGSGTQASTVRFSDESWNIFATEVIFRDINFIFDNGDVGMRINADRVVIENCRFNRRGNDPAAAPVIELFSLTGQSDLLWQGNELNATYSRLMRDFDTGVFFDASVASNSTMLELFNEAFNNGVDAFDYNQTTLALAEQINQLDTTSRLAWSQSQPTRVSSTDEMDMATTSPDASIRRNTLADASSARVSLITLSPQQRSQNITTFYDSLTTEMSVEQRAEVIDSLVRAALESGFSHGLGLAGNRIAGQLNDSAFNCNIVFNSRWLSNGRLLNGLRLSIDGDVVEGDLSFSANNNQFQQVLTYVEPGSASSIDNVVPGYGRLALINNQFNDDGSSVLGASVQLCNNQFNQTTATRYIEVVGAQLMICQNIMFRSDNSAIYYQSSYGQIGAMIANNLGNVQPL